MSTPINGGGPAVCFGIRGTVVYLSAQDSTLLCQNRWMIGSNGYVYKSGARKRGQACLMHRIVAGARRGQEVHHKNGIKTDNRRINLEVTTASAHQRNHHSHLLAERNRAKRKHSSTGKCSHCGKIFEKHPDHRGSQSCCNKRCAILRAVSIRTNKYYAP